MINSCMLDKPTKRIANYVISDRKIGCGSFGQVYLGTDRSNNNNEVAIKVISRAKLSGKRRLMQKKIPTCSIAK